MRDHKVTASSLGSGLSRLAMLFSALILCSCALRDGVEEPMATLRAGAPVDYPAPLPTLTPIYVDKTDPQGKAESRLAFRAWDFNADGRFDMVEVLDAKGQLTVRLYDLDFDGVVDFQRQLTPNAPVTKPNSKASL